MNKRKIVILVMGMMLATGACSQHGRVESAAYGALLSTLLRHSVDEISVADLGAASGLSPFVLIDARERAEFEVSHIEGAVWVGYDDFDIGRMEGIAMEDTIVVYCSVGYRSEKIAERLEAAGFSHVSNLYGGIFEWKNQDGEVVGPDGSPTERVHAFDRTWGRWLKEGEKVYNEK
jgi:rhodanese-related sulfurtransferase